MSSTGRGRKGGGESEFFPTPAYPVERLLERLQLPGGRWLEAGAGDGAIIRAVARPDVRWTAVELRPECEPALVEAGASQVVIGNFLTAAAALRCDGRFAVAMFNPPFSLALQFVQLALELAEQVVVLERSPWILDSEDRYAFFADKMPDEYRIGRVDFNGEGGDSIPYSWFHWTREGLEHPRTRGTLEALRRTPAAQRVPGNLPPRRQLELVRGGS